MSKKINTDPKKIEEVLSRGVVDVIEKEHLRKKMLLGKKLRIYLGIDPSGSRLHIGHALPQFKLRDFQELGHQIIIIIGDYTVRVGDHSDQLEKRKVLSIKQIEENMKKYKSIIGKVLDLSLVEFRYNSEWLEKLDFNDVIALARLFTVSQMIERENFSKRLRQKKPIGLEEFLYPLMQGYDSVALDTDIEIGGTDQLFNLLAGRKIMEAFDKEPQDILTVPMLMGLDGQKMSKSKPNCVWIDDPADKMYGKLMSIKDELISHYFKLATRIPKNDLKEIKKELKKGANPLPIKKKLAFGITKNFHSENEALKAEKEFERVVQKGKLPEKIKQVKVSKTPKALIDLLAETGFVKSKSEAKRLTEQGGVEINGKKVKDPKEKVSPKNGMVVRAGKRRYVKLKAEG